MNMSTKTRAKVNPQVSLIFITNNTDTKKPIILVSINPLEKGIFPAILNHPFCFIILI